MQDFVGTKVLILRRNYHFSGETIVLWLNLILGEEILGRVEKKFSIKTGNFDIEGKSLPCGNL